MRFASFGIRPEEIDAVAHAVECVGGGWVRFGSDILIYATNSNWNAVSSSIESGR